MNFELKADQTVQIAIPGGEVFHLVLGKIIKFDQEFVHLELATGSHEAISEFTNIKYPIEHPNYKTDVKYADIKMPLRYIVKEVDMNDETIPFYEVKQSPINHTACFFAPNKQLGTVLDIDFKAKGLWVARHSNDTCSIPKKTKGLIPKAFPDYHVVFIPFGKNKLQTADLREWNKKDPKEYSRLYMEGLRNMIAPLQGFQRKFVSEIKDNKISWYGFTNDNEYFVPTTKVVLEMKNFGAAFTPTYVKDLDESEDDFEKPQNNVIYVRTLYKGFPGKRAKVEWFDPNDYPGLDKFLTFVRSKGEHEIFKERDDKQIITSMKKQGQNTIFADLAAGYFFTNAISKSCNLFKEKYMWMY